LLTGKHIYAEFSKARMFLRYCVRFVVGYHGYAAAQANQNATSFFFLLLSIPLSCVPVCSQLISLCVLRAPCVCGAGSCSLLLCCLFHCLLWPTNTMWSCLRVCVWADGAAELGQPIGVVSSAGRAHRRQLVVAAGVAAAVVLCCVGIAAGARHSTIVTMGDSPLNTLSEFSMGSVLNQMRPVRGRTAKPVQQAKYGYMDAPSPHYDSYLGEQANYLHNQQTLGLSPALNRARQSQQDMTSLVNYYAQRSPALNPSAYSSESSYPSLVDGYNTLDHASTVWNEHAQHLNELNEEIMRQQNTLHRMNMGERLLSSRHEQIKTEISKLMSASAEVSSQLEELKGQYSVQINDLKAQYKDLAKALKTEKEAAQDELTKNIKEQNQLRDEIQEAMQKDAYYGTQARHAEEDVENYRNRAKDWEAEEKQNSIDVKTWEDVSLCACASFGVFDFRQYIHMVGGHEGGFHVNE